MAVNEKNYVNSDSKVKAAKAKLAAANSALAQIKNSKLPGAAARIAELDNQIKVAKKEVTTAENAAKEYFNANKESLKAAEEKKTKRQRAESKAAAESILSSGYLSPEQTAAIKAEQERYKGPGFGAAPTAQVTSGPTGPSGAGDTGIQITSLNDALTYLTTEGNKEALIKAQKDLGKFGYTGNTIGEPDINFQAALTKAAEQYKSLPEAWRPKSFLDFISNPIGGGGSAAGAGGPKPMAYISSDTEANVLVNDVFKKELGRVATDSELSYFKKALKAFQQANPASYGSTSQTSSGNSAEYVRQLIAGEAKVKKPTKEIKVLLSNLNKEYTTKQADKYVSELDALQQTAKANGLPSINETKLEEYRTRLKNGETLDVLKKAIRASVANTLSSNKAVADMLNAGQDLEDIYAPYKQTMASILEIPYDKIDLNDPTLSKAIGAEASMPLYQYKQLLRQDPRWQYTDNARETVNTGLMKVLRDFGFMG